MKRTGICLVASMVLIVQLLAMVTLLDRVSAYTPHAPIYINGNGGFNSSNGVTGGNGTQGNPYVIEGWEINATIADGIKVSNTNAYFVIRSVNLHSGSSQHNGITFSQVSNGRIENSTISFNAWGIRLGSVNNIAIRANSLTNNYCGIESDSSNNVSIENNAFSMSIGIGVLLYSSDVTVKGNNISSNGNQGIYAGWSSNNVTITENRISFNGYYGIQINASLVGSFAISHNQLYSNNLGGIALENALNSTIIYNTLSWNIGYGLSLMNSVGTQVHHNNFINNTMQAFDDKGPENSWDNGCSGGGNYWSDYIDNDSIDCRTGGAGNDGFGDAPYVLDSNSQDDFPFMVPLDLSMNNTPPMVMVTSPNGGENWAGGSVHPILWTMNDDNDTTLKVWINYSADGGGSWIQIPGAQGISLLIGNRSFSWTVPSISTTMALVKVDALDSNGSAGSDKSDYVFTIATNAPFIVSTIPPDGAVNVDRYAAIEIVFSEMMNASSVGHIIIPVISLFPSWLSNDTLELNHSTPFSSCTTYNVTISGHDPDGNDLMPGPVPNPFSFSTGCPNPVILNTDPADGRADVALYAPIYVNFSAQMNTSSVNISIFPTITFNESWSMNFTMVKYGHITPFAICTNYTVNITGQDISGYPLVSGPVPNPWTFSTCSFNPPSVSIIYPVGGEDWTGDYVKTLSWNITDPDDPLSNITTDVWYSTNGGSSWIYVAGLPGSALSYDWLLPFVNTTAAKIMVCAKDPMNNTGCGYSGIFTIDSASPTVSSTIPPDGASDVLLNQTVKVYWSEGMNAANGSFDFNPPVAGNSSWNSGRTIVDFIPAGLLSMCTNYSVTLARFKDASDPGNAMTAPLSFSFSTFCPGPPSLSLLLPVGGEYWAGGSTHQITWSVTDDNTPMKNITIFINYTSSVSSGPIVGPITIVTSHLWTLPSIDATDVKVNITAIDGDSMASWDESGYLTIDSTPPALILYSPQGWNVPLDSFVKATFSEQVDAQSGNTAAAFGLRDQTAGTWVKVSWTRMPPTWPQEIHYVPIAPLVACHAYRAMINSSYADRASWPLTNFADWTFHTVCAPSVTILTSLAGKDWTGGSPHDVSWSMSDEIDGQLVVWTNYSRNGGVDGYPYSIVSGLRTVGTSVHPWVVPMLDTANARLRVTVMDSSGLRAVAESVDFKIDSTPPSIMSSVPLNGSSGATITDTVQVVFSEAIVRSTAETAFSISPDPGSITFAWGSTTSGKDIMIVGHKPFKSKTDYRVTFGTALRDVSDPGNNPVSPLWISFSTKPPPPVSPPVALAVGKNQVAVGERVTLDGSGSTGTNLTYIWTILDNQNNIVEVLAGKIVTYTFQSNGRYDVVLTVVDKSTGLSGTDDLEIVVTSSDNAGLIILLASAMIAGALIGGTEVGRVTLFMLLAVPVYRRKMKGKDDSLGRGMVLGYIMVHPGDTYSDIKHNLDLNDGTLTWHLSKLEKEEMIKSKVKGTRKHYYPSSMPLPFEDGGELHEIEKLLIHTVRSDPGRPVKLLAEELGVSSQLALYHLRKLTQKGYLRLERRGLHIEAYPAKKENS